MSTATYLRKPEYLRRVEADGILFGKSKKEKGNASSSSSSSSSSRNRAEKNEPPLRRSPRGGTGSVSAAATTSGSRTGMTMPTRKATTKKQPAAAEPSATRSRMSKKPAAKSSLVGSSDTSKAASKEKEKIPFLKKKSVSTSPLLSKGLKVAKDSKVVPKTSATASKQRKAAAESASTSSGASNKVPNEANAQNRDLSLEKQFADVKDPEHKKLLEESDLTMEASRRSTFKWSSLKYEAQRLAVHGFYWLGDKDRVQCFMCHKVLRESESRDFAEVHRRASPDCSMAKREDKSNAVQQQQQQQPENNEAIPSTSSEAVQLETNETITQASSEHRLAQSCGEEVSTQGSSQQIIMQPNEEVSMQVSSQRIISQPSEELLTANSQQTIVQPMQELNANESSQRRFMQPSEESSPHNHNNSSSSWSSGRQRVIAQPSGESHSAGVSRLVQQQQQQRREFGQPSQVAMACEDDESDHDESDDLDVDLDLDPTAPDAQMRREMNACEEPTNPHMKSVASRMSTFRDGWSASGAPEMVAQAGFFWLGLDERVKCWYCDVELKDWDPSREDPWLMHAYKRPSCQFLKRNRSEQFIEEAIDSHYRNQLRAAAAAAAVRTPVLERRHQWGSGSIEAGPDVLPEYVPDDRPQSVINREELEEAMKSEPVLKALRHGFERSHIERVMWEQIEENEVAYQGYEALLDALQAS